MKTFSRNQSLAAALLAAVTFTLPATASAQSSYYGSDRTYIECKKDDKDNQIVGGIIGAVAGGVIGSQVAGNGARTEGSVLGAAIGAAAGAGIADDRRNCRTEAGYTRPNTYSNRTYGSTYYPSTRTSYPTRTYDNGYYRTSHPVTRTPGRAVGNPHVHGQRGYYRSLSDIDWEISRLRAERERLKDERRYRYSQYLDRRIHEIGEKIGYLKDERKRIKKHSKYDNYDHRSYY